MYTRLLPLCIIYWKKPWFEVNDIQHCLLEEWSDCVNVNTNVMQWFVNNCLIWICVKFMNSVYSRTAMWFNMKWAENREGKREFVPWKNKSINPVCGLDYDESNNGVKLLFCINPNVKLGLEIMEGVFLRQQVRGTIRRISCNQIQKPVPVMGWTGVHSMHNACGTTRAERCIHVHTGATDAITRWNLLHVIKILWLLQEDSAKLL